MRRFNRHACESFRSQAQPPVAGPAGLDVPQEDDA